MDGRLGGWDDAEWASFHAGRCVGWEVFQGGVLEGELCFVIGFGGVEESDVVGGCVVYNLVCHGIGLENLGRVMKVSVVVSNPTCGVCAVSVNNFCGEGVANMAGDVVV